MNNNKVRMDNNMIRVARVLGRLLAVLINRDIISVEDADYILAPVGDDSTLEEIKANLENEA